MRRFSIWDVIISVFALTVVCVTIVPAVARLQRTPEDARCQSNLARWAGAMQLYLSDWNGCYPTNRYKLPGGAVGPVATNVPLSPYNPVNQQRFVSSFNWVEALFPYLIDGGRKTGRTYESFLACPKASGKWPPPSQTARVSYVFNYNLLEQPSVFNRNRAKLMLIRELDRLVDSCCRPNNNSTFNPSAGPQSPFLLIKDASFGATQNVNYKLHSEGSHILFADGHVQYFGAEYFSPINSYSLNPTQSWDPETQQWWNWVNKDPALDKAIAITP